MIFNKKSFMVPQSLFHLIRIQDNMFGALLKDHASPIIMVPRIPKSDKNLPIYCSGKKCFRKYLIIFFTHFDNKMAKKHEFRKITYWSMFSTYRPHIVVKNYIPGYLGAAFRLFGKDSVM